VAALAATICAMSPSVRADGGSQSGALAAAEQALTQAQLQAVQARDAVGQAAAQLAAARAELAQADAQLAAIQARIASLDAAVKSDQAQVSGLDGQVRGDKRKLAAFLRTSYELSGDQTTVEYLVDAKNIGDLVDRIDEISHVAGAGNLLVDRIGAEESQAQHVLAASIQARSQASAAEEQAATQQVIVAGDQADAARMLAADQVIAGQAEGAVAAAQNQYDLISEYGSGYAAAAAALAQARADDTIFPPIAGPTFTEDTDLTLPSGESSQTIDSFLAGTDLAGLGPAYMEAERTYGVSARYLVAHSIEESGWGTSAIAQDKHNLFGYGADDGDPYGDAMSFSSFSACILFVAQQVRIGYLTPGGAYYHGPTLRGMNVDYASDPLWASQIAAIAQTIPLP
jgi:beta-N-acetylglucosaminidase